MAENQLGLSAAHLSSAPGRDQPQPRGKKRGTESRYGGTLLPTLACAASFTKSIPRAVPSRTFLHPPQRLRHRFVRSQEFWRGLVELPGFEPGTSCTPSKKYQSVRDSPNKNKTLSSSRFGRKT